MPNPRAVVFADELRRAAADPPERGELGDLRPRHREPEPAGVRGDVPERLPASGEPELAVRVLAGVFQGTYVDSKHTDVEKLVEFVKNKATSKAEQRSQLDLLAKLNGMHQASRPNDPQLEARIQSFELASRMQTEASDAFDVTKEPKHVLDAYGPGEQARSLLLARRLIERAGAVRPGQPRAGAAVGQSRRFGEGTPPARGAGG